MKQLFYQTSLILALSVCGLFGLAGCSDDNDPAGGGETPTPAEELVFEMDLDLEASDPILLVSEESYSIPFHGEGVEEIIVDNESAGWQVTVNEAAGNIVLTAPAADAETDKDYTLQLTVTGGDDQSIKTDAINFYHVTFDDPAGTFVLNEGNMTTENGSLIYITPEGYVVDNAYRRVNGTELGNVTQDMSFYDGKLYIISQNGDTNAVGTSFENDGMLVVADARTLQKVSAFSREELSGLDWPTHIAVIDEQHVYIRDNAGVWRLNMDDASLTFVAGSENAPKSRFAVVNGEVYFPKNDLLAGLHKIDPDADQVTSVADLSFWMATPMINFFLGIAAADDGNLWVMGTTATNGGKQGIISLGKLDLATEELVQNVLSEQPNETYDCCFAAHGNTVYYAHGTTIYRAQFDPAAGTENVVDEPLTDLSALDDNAAQLYNGLGVNPATGHVYVNTIRGMGNFFSTNSIWEFDFDASLETPVHKFDNYTHFPAGFYFNR